MAKRLKDHIEDALENLTGNELKRFKRKLNETKLEPGYETVPMGTLEHAVPMDVADILVRFYREEYGLRVTTAILEDINQRPLADSLREALRGELTGYSACVPVPLAAISRKPLPADPTFPAPSLGQRSRAIEMHFVDRHRDAIITRTSVVLPVLLGLLLKQLLNLEQYWAIVGRVTPRNMMRDLFGIADGWGQTGKDELYELLRVYNEILIRDLGGQ